MENLFVNMPHVMPSATEKLPADVDKWPEVLVNLVRSLFPEARQMAISVNYSKKDDELGAAVGSIKVENQKRNKHIFLPVIAKNFRLFPLDIMMRLGDDGKYHAQPLNVSTFKEALFEDTVFKELESPESYMHRLFGPPNAIGSAAYPPNSGRYGYASAGYPILDMISDSLAPGDHAALRQAISSSKEHLVGYEKSGHVRILQALMKAKPLEKIAVDTEKKRIFHVANRDNEMLDLVGTGTERFNPVRQQVTAERWAGEACKLVDVKEHLNDIHVLGEAAVKAKDVPTSSVLLTPPNDRPTEKPLDRFGVVSVRTKSGLYVQGILFPRVIDFDCNASRLKILAGKTHSAIQPRLVGDQVAKEVEFETKAPAAGDFGTFVYTKDGKALATIPVHVTAKVNGVLNVTCIRGHKFKIAGAAVRDDGCYEPASAPGMKEPEPTKVGNPEMYKLLKIVRVEDKYYLPSDFRFVPLKQPTEMSENYALAKAASILDGSPLILIHNGHGSYAMKGHAIEKYAMVAGWDKSMLTPAKANFLMYSLGLPVEKTAEVYKVAKEHGAVAIHGLETPEIGPAPAHEKRAMELPKALLYKEASYFDDAQVVDSLLALNFINQDNAEKFVSFIPLLQHTSELLAQLTMAARLGFNEIPEGAATSAMRKLQDVIEGLKRLKFGGQDALA